MQNLLSVGEMRMSDAIAISSFVPGMELMRRAGEGIFRAAEWKAPVAVVCGTGNNAGDGYVTAMMLQEAGIACELLLQEELQQSLQLLLGQNLQCLNLLQLIHLYQSLQLILQQLQSQQLQVLPLKCLLLLLNQQLVLDQNLQ